MRRADAGALALAAFAGASLWITLGVLTLTQGGTERAGAVPSLEMAAGLVITAVLAAWALSLRTSEAWPLATTALVWLPWLPSPVPRALLVWEGPLEGVVWAVALGGVVAARIAAWRRGGARVRRPLVVFSSAFFATSLAAAVALSPVLPTGDEPHYLVIAQSLLHDGDLRIENNHARGDYRAYHEAALPPHYLRRGVDGEIYSIHAPGVAVLVAPAFLAAGYPGAVVVIACLVALASATMWRAAEGVVGEARAAWAGTLAVAMSAPWFLHSVMIYPDPVGGAIAAAALAMLVRFEQDTPGRARMAAMGALLAVLPWLHTRLAVLAGAFGLVLLARIAARRVRLAERGRLAAAFLVVPVVSCLGWLAMFQVIYGDPRPSAPYGAAQNSAAWLPAGLVGLAFDQQFGLVANAPVFALLPFGWMMLWRQRRRLAIELLVLAVPYILVVGSFSMWWGGLSAPARFLTPIVPLASPVLAAAWAGASAGVRALFVTLVGAGAANAALRAWAADGSLLHNVRNGYDTLLVWLAPHVSVPLGVPSLHRLGIESTVLLGCIWLLAGCVAALTLTAVVERWQPRSIAFRWTAAVIIAASCGMAALAASWRAIRVEPLTSRTSGTRFVREWMPSRQPLLVRLPGGGRTDAAALLASIQISAGTEVPYGSVTVARLSGAADLEPHGIWTRGDSSVTLMARGGESGTIVIEVVAGWAPAGVEFDVNGRARRLSLGPHERRRLELPPGRWVVRTSGAFRPVDHDPSSSDARRLGVRLEFPRAEPTGEH